MSSNGIKPTQIKALIDTPLTIGAVTVPNRVMMSPMSQRRATLDGRATDWHLVHYGSRAVGGVGLIMIEDCAVQENGRLGLHGLGLYLDGQQGALARVVDFCHEAGAAVGIQLGHAGRKAYSRDPAWSGKAVAPSRVAYAEDWRMPRALDAGEVRAFIDAFGAAATRAVVAGIDVVEVHAAHGYLLHEFLAPSANLRTDEYGGTDGGRRLLFQVVDRVRAAIGDRALAVRLSVSTIGNGDFAVQDAVLLSRELSEHGVDLIDASAGGLVEPINQRPVFDQPKVAGMIRLGARISTIGVGGVHGRAAAARLLARGACDLVAVGRALLENPYVMRKPS